MNLLQPMRFAPVFMEKIWGGNKIKTCLSMDYENLTNCGEAWIISGVDGNETGVIDGPLEGNNLNELIEVFMGDLVGDKVYEEFGNQFPLLIKFIDAKEWLSIQVHPDDDLAVERGLERGKTEMWYIIEADEESQLISGFNQKINGDEYLKRLNNKTLTEVMNFENVRKGDVFYMPSGRVHAIGPGILLAEIQQSSDTTYRIYDWDRVDAQGKPRELHVDEAMEAIDFNIYEGYKTSYRVVKNDTSNIIDEKYFTTNIIFLDKILKKDFNNIDSFVIYIIVEGSLTIIYKDGEMDLKLGDAILIPAALKTYEFHTNSSAKILEVYIP